MAEKTLEQNTYLYASQLLTSGKCFAITSGLFRRFSLENENLAEGGFLSPHTHKKSIWFDSHF